MAADRVAGVYAVVVDVCIAGFPLHTKQRGEKRRGDRRLSVVERTRLEAVRLTHRLAEVSLGKMRTSLYARCRGFQLGAHE